MKRNAQVSFGSSCYATERFDGVGAAKSAWKKWFIRKTSSGEDPKSSLFGRRMSPLVWIYSDCMSKLRIEKVFSAIWELGGEGYINGRLTLVNLKDWGTILQCPQSIALIPLLQYIFISLNYDGRIFVFFLHEYHPIQVPDLSAGWKGGRKDQRWELLDWEKAVTYSSYFWKLSCPPGVLSVVPFVPELEFIEKLQPCCPLVLWRCAEQEV